MVCPVCSARSMVFLAWSGRRPPLHGQPNVITCYRCEQGHSFHTVTFFDGIQYQQQYALSTELISMIRVCWDYWLLFSINTKNSLCTQIGHYK